MLVWPLRLYTNNELELVGALETLHGVFADKSTNIPLLVQEF